MKPLEVERWERARRKGGPRFVLIWGVVIYGGGLFLSRVVQLLMANAAGLRMGQILDLFVWCAVGGLLFGTVMWRLLEWRYKRAKARGGA